MMPLGVPSSNLIGVLIKKRKFGHTQKHQKGKKRRERETPGTEERPGEGTERRQSPARRDISGETKPADTMTLDLEPQNHEKINLLFTPPRVWYFVMGALAD